MFSELEQYGRTNGIYKITGQYKKETFEELNNFQNISKNFVENLSFKKIIFNPCFSNSKNLGGADGDLIIDNELIDFKTVKKIEITDNILCQLIGYYTLSYFENIEINKLSIFFARYNLKIVLEIDNLIIEKEKLLKYFENKYNFKIKNPKIIKNII